MIPNYRNGLNTEPEIMGYDEDGAEVLWEELTAHSQIEMLRQKVKHLEETIAGRAHNNPHYCQDCRDMGPFMPPIRVLQTLRKAQDLIAGATNSLYAQRTDSNATHYLAGADSGLTHAITEVEEEVKSHDTGD